MENPQPPNCFLCCNVITGTLLKAFMYLFTGFMAVTMVVLEKVGYFDFKPYFEDEYTRQVFEMYTASTKAFVLALMNGVFVMLIGSLAVAGIVQNKAKLLLPLFVMQLFTVMSSLGALFSVTFLTRQLSAFIDRIGYLVGEDFKNWILSLNGDMRYVAVVLFFATVFLVEMQFIKAIYQSYKHIILQEISQRRVTTVSIVGVPEDEDNIETPIYKLPKYEDLQKVPLVEDQDDMYPTKPPAYEA